jgi:hypothetical protein
MGSSPLPPGIPQQGPRPPSIPSGPGAPPRGPGAPPAPRPGAAPQGPVAPAVCTGVPLLNLSCAQLTAAVGPSAGTKPGPPPNKASDVLLIQKLINLVVKAGYVQNAVLGDGDSKLTQPLNENGQWSTQLFNAIKQIELLYFHGRANPHGIGVIDSQADESMFVFLVELANGSKRAQTHLSVQMRALALAMIPNGKVLIDAGGTGPDGKPVVKKEAAVDIYLPILLDALTQSNLNDTDMVLIALACVYTETSNFVPVNEGMYDLNTTGTFTDKATGATWTDTPAGVHSDYGLLKQHYNAALKANPKFPLRGTETFAPNTLGPGGSTMQGNIYDAYTNSRGKDVLFGGNTQPGDGWKYRGRGLIQLTGRGRYAEADTKAHTGTKFIDDPDLVNSREYAGIVVAAFLSASEPRVRHAMESNDLATVRKIVNGGDNGLPQFRVAMAAGRAVIAQAIINQAKSVTRAKRTHRRKHPKHPASPASPAK